LTSYDEAIAKGKTDFTAYKAKVTAMLKMSQKKYGTDNADVLAKIDRPGNKIYVQPYAMRRIRNERYHDRPDADINL
jgi:hypothetical protein